MMPDPSRFTTRASFMRVCVPQVIEEGTAEDGTQANVICSSMWRNRNKEMKASEVQSLIFNKKRSPSDVNGGNGWTVPTAKTWLKDHNFKSGNVDEPETGNTIRFRQFDPSECSGGYQMLTRNFPVGISAVACNRRKDVGGFEMKRFMPIEIKELDERTGAFAGWGAVIGTEDEGGDTIRPNSMKKSLKKRRPKIYLLHDTPVGVTTVAEEKDYGLWVEGQPDESRDGLDAREKLKSGALDALSIGYRTVKAKETGRFKRDLLEIDVYHVGLVPYGMHPGAVITQVKALDLEGIKSIRELEHALRDAGLPKKAREILCSPGYIASLHQGEPDDVATLVDAIKATTATLK